MIPYIYNTYFIIKLPEMALNNLLSHCVEKEVTRWNNNRTKCGIKLPMYAKVPNIFKNKGNVKQYTHAEIRIELQKPEWISDGN